MPRVAFYSHDTYGLGHLRRCLKLAEAFATHLDDVTGLVLTGSPWSSRFPRPDGFRCVELPPVTKTRVGDYRPREANADWDAVLDERRRRIEASVRRLQPDLFLVDNVPCGLRGEVMGALRWQRQRRMGRAVLVLRDILDRPERIVAEWESAGAEEALDELFDEIWVFGDDADAERLVAAGPLSRFRRKVHACGHLGAYGATATRPADRGERLVLVTGGGGGDAAPLVTTYLEALRSYRPAVTSQVVLGPDYPGVPEFDVTTPLVGRRFVPDLPTRIAASDVVVAMAGYNTVGEILEAGRPAVLVPRVAPREEQWLRGQKWQEAGRVKVVHPASLTAARLWSCIEELLEAPPAEGRPFTAGSVASRRAARLLGLDKEVEPCLV